MVVGRARLSGSCDVIGDDLFEHDVGSERLDFARADDTEVVVT